MVTITEYLRTGDDAAQRQRWGVLAASAAAFALLFAAPMTNMVRTWLQDPDAGHGLLLAPIALVLAWRIGIREDHKSNVVLGVALLVLAVLLRYGAALAAEVFFARISLMLGLSGLVIFVFGFRQVLSWWLPVTLLGLSIPIPEVILSSLALPLQLQASKLGAAMLSARGIPVHLDGNVIRLPGHDLFVTEACSGLRSLTALISLGVLFGGTMLKYPLSRVALIAIALPVGVLVNGIRVFGTGFLLLFVSPKLAEGFSHLMEGWILFLLSLAILGAIAWGIGRLEGVMQARKEVHA